MIRLVSIRALVIASTLGLAAACGGSPPPVVGPVAADNGQPVMQAALAALEKAQADLQSAEADKGGYRMKGLALIQQAIDQVSAGMQYAAAHASEVGEAEGMAEAEPVDAEVAGAERQPHMRDTIIDLREARKQLRHAKRDKGGFRRQALGSVQQAIDAVKEGIAFANSH